MKRVMKFGSEEALQCIEDLLSNPEDTQLQIKLYDCIKRAALPQLYGMSLPAQDADDVIQVVVLSVFKHLGEFYLDYVQKNRSYAERSKWLWRIIRNTCLSYMRKGKAEELFTIVPLDSVEELKDETTKYDLDNSDAEYLADVLESVCIINTTVDNILAFLLLSMRKEKKNSKPKALAEELDGMYIQDVYRLVCQEMQDWGFETIALKAIDILQEKIKGHETDIFHASPRDLTDKSNWIRTKIKEQFIQN